MADDPTEEMIRREISEAVRILKEDGVHVTKHMRSLLDERFPREDPTPEPPKEPGEGDPPPQKPSKEETRRKSLWWGERE